MLPWTNHRHCSVAMAALAYGISLALAPLVAQTLDATPDVPAVPIEAAPLPAAAQPVPQTSAATPASENVSPSDLHALSNGAGPAPVSGPGAAPSSNLGDNLDSAAFATRLPFRVTATLGEAYNNNIFSTKHKTDDFITRIAVTGEARFGGLQRGQQELYDVNFFDFVYTPTYRLYAEHSNESGFDQDIDVLYAHRWSALTLSLEQVYTSLQTTNASVGGLVTADTYQTTLGATYVYSPKIDFVGNFTQEFTDYNQIGYTDSKEWAGEFYGMYHFDPKLAVGIGPRFGYLDLHAAPAETFQQVLARAIYVPSDKLNFHLNVGLEDRQYQTYQRSDTLEPIFKFTAVYLPQPSTNLSLIAARHFTPSYGFVGNDYLATTVYTTATQRFFNAYYLSLNAGYENDDYAFNLGGPSRNDNYFFVTPSLHWKPNGWLEVAAFDKYEEDSSNFTAFSYDTNQVGVSCSATY